MADCGATGSALDRTVRAMGGGPQQQQDVSKVLGSLLGHVSLAEPHAMPHAAPPTLVMPHYNVSLLPPGAPPQAPTAAPRHDALAPPVVHHMPLPQQMMHHPNPYHFQMVQQQRQQQQQQQQMMMMMNMQMQQQQQQQQHMLAQQQQQHWKPAAAQYKPSVKSDAKSFLQEKSLDAETKEEIRQHLEAVLQDDGWQVGHEGLTQGAGMEELAAAWAQAEADYDNDMVNQATNMAASVDVVPDQYIFQHTQAPLSADEVSSMDWMDEGLRHFGQGHVQEAIRCFETQLQYANPDDARAWRMLGKCHAENDQDREAILCLEAAVDRDPYATDAQLELAVSHVNELNHQKALESLKAWITHNPAYVGMELTDDLYGDTTTTTTTTTTTADNSAGAFDEVQRLLLRALEFDPSNSAEILQTLGVTYNVNRDYEAAVKAFQRALDERPDDYQLWNKLGATLANGNQSEKALPAYNRALELRPRYARAWLNMAISYSNLTNYEEAARCYLQTLSLNPAATHCWSYLRIALSCSEKWDLIPLAAAQDLASFREHYDFVLYENAAPPPATD